MNERELVIVALPMLLRGGTELQTLAMVRVLREESYHVVVCCYYEFEQEIIEEFTKENVEVHCLGLKRFSRGASFAQMLKLIRVLRGFLKSRSPHIVHVQYVSPGLIPVLAARAAGVKRIFATIHYPRHAFGKRETALVHIAAKLCSVFLCNSLATERSWFGSGSLIDPPESNAAIRHYTIYNSVDTARIEVLASSAKKDSLREALHITGKHVVGVVARLRSEKGHSFLFHAFRQVLASNPNTTLLIVGDGPDKGALQSLAKRLNIDENLVWTGAKSQEETFQLYGIMDLVVVPSEYEGFGLSAAEAMAAGLPVVATNADGLREVIKDGFTGLLSPFGDIEGMSSSIVSLLADPSRAAQFGASGKDRVRELFSLARFHQAIKAVYEKS